MEMVRALGNGYVNSKVVGYESFPSSKAWFD